MTIRKGEASPSSLQKSLGSDFQLPSRLGSSLFQGWRPVQGWPESPHPWGGGSSTRGAQMESSGQKRVSKANEVPRLQM